MKINLSDKEKLIFLNMLKTKDDNIEISDLLLSAFQYTDFIDLDDLKQRIADGEKEDEAIKNIILDAFEVDDNSFRESFKHQVSISKCNPSKYLNEYVKLLGDTKISLGSYKLEKISYEPYQLFALDDIEVTSDLKEISKVGYFDQKFSYISLFENNDLWMSLNPNEINTMEASINRSKGNVLILGLGMGYIAYMMSLKPEVESITIVEKNPENIKIFKKFLLKKFANFSKIHIIENDAIYYVKNNHNFNYIFADLWFNPEDGLEYYLKLNSIEKESHIKIDYWLETSLKQMKRRYLIELIKEQLDGVGPEAYEAEEELPDRIFKTLYNDTKCLNIQSIKEIEELLK